MNARDHNKTLTFIYAFLSVYVFLPVLAAPWLIISNLKEFSSPRSGTQVLIATIAVITILLCLAILFLSTALSLYRRRPRARRLAIISALVVFPLCPPITIYTWWYMHSEGGKQLYFESQSQS